MIAWLSWLFDPATGADEPASTAHEDLRALRIRRRQLMNNLCSLRAYGFDTLARDKEAAVKTLDRKILALQIKSGLPDEAADLS